MSRGSGEISPVQELIPEWLAVVIALLTQLGDGWFLITLLAVLYWTRVKEQDEILLVGGILAGGIGLYRGLKYLFGFPRPEQPLLDPELLPWVVRPLYELTAHASGYGFPSGHATMTTIVYFGLATVLTVGTQRLRYVVAGTLVAIVGFSRIALGVHFLVDIVAGIAIGALLLYVAFGLLGRLSRNRGTALFATGIVLNGFYVVTSDGHVEAVIMLGVSLGLFGGWQLILLARELAVVERPSEGLRPAAVRLGLTAVALGPLVAALDLFPLLSEAPYPVAGLVGLGTAIVIVVPVARYSRRVQRVVVAVSFWTGALVGGARVLLRVATWRRLFDEVRQFLYRLRQ